MPNKQQFDSVTTKNLKVLPGGTVEGISGGGSDFTYIELAANDPVPEGTAAGTYIFRRMS